MKTKKLRRKDLGLPVRAGVVQPRALVSHDGKVLAYFIQGAEQEQDFVIHAENLFFSMLDMLKLLDKSAETGTALSYDEIANRRALIKQAEEWDK